ncbi:transposase [Cucumis melo var. makuwa]|uniref:Transposase n=1 Tax=Cucumis melo var. makuwa TaxID=1194695 RepID=A0A5A7UCB0_CUCMM|nr:transposase [Cucumis melo var. makuwa]
MKYEKIHACRNDCCLFRKELSDANVCPSCGMSRWKIPKNSKKEVKNVPVKVMWYFSPIPRFERMFRSKETSKLLTWHGRKREVNDLLQHPKDALSWKKIDNLWPEFGSEPRNLRLALSTDGVNPHGDLSSRYSCWPVMLVTYNLPPWLCMKRKFLMLTALISGPKQPGNEIDVYLAPLVDDLKILWHDGVECYDAYQDQCFRLKAILLWTINDFPAYGNLCGCTVKGYHACPICGEKTSSIYLPKGRKMAYIGHRKFLPRHHPYRKQKKVFNGAQELELAPEPLSGEEIFIQTNVMHIEKNVCANLIGTLLDIPGKTKDGVKSRLDLVELNIRSELAPQVGEKKIFLPPACYTLSRAEKLSFCKTLSELKVPEGYSSNIQRLMSLTDLKLYGLKSHDHHVLMQQLLPVAIRGILPKHEHSTRKDVVYPSNYTDVNGIIKLLNRYAMNNMEDVDMIRIPMNELIFGSDKFVYLAREDLLHYCGMVEIGYMCILAYITCLWDKCDCAKNFFVIDQSKISSHIKDRDLRSRNLANQLEAVNLEQKVLIPYNTGFHWMLHVIDLRENCVYVLDSLRSKVNEDIHGIINRVETWQAKHDLQRYRSTPKWRPVKCPRQLDSVGYGYYVQKYIHEIVHNSSTSITNLFNTKNAYRQEEIDEIRTEWTAFVSRFV